jgi:FMS-like tyrosine kinase 1
LLPYNESYEFPRENLKMGKMLGAGAFGRVVKAEAEGIVPWEESTVVAVKMLKPKPTGDYDYLKALMVELKIMIHLGKHINILNVLGACTTNLRKRELLVITEYCRFGNIQKYLVCHRTYFINQVNPLTGLIDYEIGQQEYDSTIPFPGHKTIDRASISGRKSVRYTIPPRANRAESIQSDDGQIVVTGMTTLQSDGLDVVDESSRRLRTLSSVSSNDPGPVWRANVGGDYDQRSI